MLRFPQDLVVVAGRHALQVADHEHENLATILVIRQVHGKPSASVLRRRTEQKLHYRLNLMPRDLVSPPGHGVLGYAPRAAGYGFTGLIRPVADAAAADSDRARRALLILLLRTQRLHGIRRFWLSRRGWAGSFNRLLWRRWGLRGIVGAVRCHGCLPEQNEYPS
ncbi:hypothetical protein EES45_34265 [Streptomyces sp. ADI97-07]|nr:hypothetical protein EES45_34265 [Streptomyces sp. ADI97-07]